MNRKYTIYFIATFFVSIVALFPQSSFANIGYRDIGGVAETFGVLFIILLCGVVLLLLCPALLTLLERRRRLKISSLSLKMFVSGAAGVLLSILLWLLVSVSDIIFFRTGVYWIGSSIILGVLFALIFPFAIYYYAIPASFVLSRMWRWSFGVANVIFVVPFTILLARFYWEASKPRWITPDPNVIGSDGLGASKGYYSSNIFLHEPSYGTLFRVFLIIVILVAVSSLMRFVFRKYARSLSVTEKVDGSIPTVPTIV